MSYSRPAYNAVNESFQGASAYTRPAYNAVNQGFASALQVSGWAPTNFGLAKFVHASGWKATSFGNIILTRLPVTGFMPVNTGLPRIVSSCPVAGFNPARFGSAALLPHAVGFMPAKFGSPSAIGAFGWKATSFGNIILTRLPTTGFKPANIGTPRLVSSCPVSGFMPTKFGSAALLPHAVGFMPTKFGGPQYIHVLGWKSTVFGSSTAQQTNSVSAWRATTFGDPTRAVRQTPMCEGFYAPRFGRFAAIRYVGTSLNRKLYVYPNRGMRPVRFGAPHL